jgi:hypothetical protein
VLDALTAWSQSHWLVAHDAAVAQRLGLPTNDQPVESISTLFTVLRRAGVTSAALVLPVAGDVRGLGGSAELNKAALWVEQAIVFAEAGLAIVPKRSFNGNMVWTVFEAPGVGPAEEVPISEAEHGLSGATRAAATTLVDLGVARKRPNVRQEIDDIVAATPELAWPEGMPGRALRVLQRAREVEAILTVAATDAPGRALTARAAEGRQNALRPLATAVRLARAAAINDAIRVLLEPVGSSVEETSTAEQ